MTKKTRKGFILIFMLFIFVLSGPIEIKFKNTNVKHKRVRLSGLNNPIEYVWNYTWDLSLDDMGKSIFIDQNDNIFILGDTQPSADAIYLSKFNKYGIQEWELTWGSVTPFGMCTDNNGNIYVVGDGGRQSYLVKFNNSGQFEWSKSYSRVGSDHFSAVATDSLNFIYVTGYKDTDGQGLREDIRLIKFYENGTQIWDKTWGDGNVAGQGGKDLVIDANNFIYVTGYDHSIRDMVLIKFDSMGNQIWDLSWGSGIPIYDEGWTIDIDKAGNLYVGVILNRYGSSDISLVKFNATGSYLWNVTWGGSSVEYIYDVIVNSKNEVLCTGNTNSYGAGGSDAFLLRLTDQGLLLDDMTIGYDSTDIGGGVAADSRNRIFLTGLFRIGGRNNFFLAMYEPLPIITIYSPEAYRIYGETSPTFSISITDPSLDNTWYSINKGLNHTFTGMSGTIDQTTWDGCEDGIVIIEFYANSTLGYFSSRYIEVYKDINPPVVTINSPLPNQLYGNTTLNFNISIIEQFFNSTWYSLNDGLNYTFTGTSGTINETAWNSCENGTVTITFYANDLSGYLGSKSVMVRKDTSFPEIIIISPQQFQLFGVEAPTFNLTINGLNLETSWYSLNNSLNYTFTGTSGKINQTAWNSYGNGTITITFYANNTAGNIGYSEITVFKDIIAPTVLININLTYKIYSNRSPTFSIIVIENNLNITWYSLNNGLNYIFTGLTGTINQTAWNLCGNGTVNIKFFANDTMGNIGYESIIVHKDIISPIIQIHSPFNSQVFGTYPPDFNLSISEPYIDSLWYSLNNGVNYSINESTGKIDIILWNLCDNGNITIKFYVNDTGGNLGYSEVIIEKDAYFWDLTDTPIFIDNLNPNYNWSKTARDNVWCLGSGTWIDPYVIRNVIINGKNTGSGIEIINSYVYFRIENSILFNAATGTHPFYKSAIKLTNVHNGTLFNNTFSNNNGYGIFIENSNNNTLIENTANNNGYTGIYIEYAYDGNYLFNNTINLNGQRGLSLRQCNYHIIDGNTIEDNALIGIELWDANNNRIYNNSLKGNYDGIYVYDESNNNELSFNRVYMNDHNGIKSGIGENNTIKFNTVYNNVENGIHLFGNYANISHNKVSFNGESGIYIQDTNFTLISFNIVYNNTENGILLYSIWKICENNNILNNTIFSNQVNGLLFMFSNKNNISGNLIGNNQLRGIYIYSGGISNLFYNNSITNNGLNALDNGASNQWNNSMIGNFWTDYNGKDINDNSIGDSPYDISGTANSEDKIPIWWDAPVLSIISPTSNSLFGISSLSFEISIDEGISDTTWYSLNSRLINTFPGTTGTINQIAWDLFGNGTVTIRFFVNDSRGYITFKDVVILKDIIDPEIIIISPTHNELFGIATI